MEKIKLIPIFPQGEVSHFDTEKQAVEEGFKSGLVLFDVLSEEKTKHYAVGQAMYRDGVKYLAYIIDKNVGIRIVKLDNIDIIYNPFSKRIVYNKEIFDREVYLNSYNFYTAAYCGSNWQNLSSHLMNDIINRYYAIFELNVQGKRELIAIGKLQEDGSMRMHKDVVFSGDKPVVMYRDKTFRFEDITHFIDHDDIIKMP